MLKCLFKLLAALPLPVLHWLGDVLGYVLYVASPPDRRRIRQHLAFAQLPNHRHAVLQVCQETVKSGLELAIACFRQPAQISALFTQVYGWEHVEQAQQQGAGLLLITPHLGSYDWQGDTSASVCLAFNGNVQTAQNSSI